MKIKIALSSLMAIALAGVSSAATYAVNAGSGTTANGIGNSSGIGYAGNGTVAIGTFSPGTDFGGFGTTTDIVSAFTQFGVSTTFLAGGALQNRGQFNLSTAGTAAESPFANSDIYLLVGNNASFQTSTEFLILRSARDFLPADDASGTPIDVVFSASSELLFGATTPDLRTNSLDQSVTPGFLTQVIPEPSVALLGAFGIVGLVRRRR